MTEPAKFAYGSRVTEPSKFEPYLVFEWEDQSGARLRLLRMEPPPELGWRLERCGRDTLGADSWKFERSIMIGHEDDTYDWVVALALGFEAAVEHARRQEREPIDAPDRELIGWQEPIRLRGWSYGPLDQPVHVRMG